MEYPIAHICSIHMLFSRKTIAKICLLLTLTEYSNVFLLSSSADILSSTWWLPTELFIWLIIIFFSFIISVWFFFHLSSCSSSYVFMPQINLLILFSWFFVLWNSFRNLSMSSLDSLNIFVAIILNSLSNVSCKLVSLGANVGLETFRCVSFFMFLVFLHWKLLIVGLLVTFSFPFKFKSLVFSHGRLMHCSWDTGI